MESLLNAETVKQLSRTETFNGFAPSKKVGNVSSFRLFASTGPGQNFNHFNQAIHHRMLELFSRSPGELETFFSALVSIIV